MWLPEVFNFDSFETFLLRLSNGTFPKLRTLNMTRNETLARQIGDDTRIVYFEPSMNLTRLCQAPCLLGTIHRG